MRCTTVLNRENFLFHSTPISEVPSNIRTMVNPALSTERTGYKFEITTFSNSTAVSMNYYARHMSVCQSVVLYHNNRCSHKTWLSPINKDPNNKGNANMDLVDRKKRGKGCQMGWSESRIRIQVILVISGSGFAWRVADLDSVILCIWQGLSFKFYRILVSTPVIKLL